MAEKDRISDLPAHILDSILCFLPIQDAAKIAILSTFWNDIWFRLSELKFDHKFFRYLHLRYPNAYINDMSIRSIGLKLIKKILMHHNGRIKKFVLKFNGDVETTDFDQWLLFLTQNGVEDIDLSFPMLMKKYKLPSYIFSNSKLKKLKLYAINLEQINAHCLLPNVTSLYFEFAKFEHRNCQDCVVDLPALKNLSFVKCTDMCFFNIVAPKLDSLKIRCCGENFVFGFLPPNLDLRSITTLDLDYFSIEEFIKEFNKARQQLALNVQHLKLSISVRFQGAFIHLLRMSPKLCKLDISIELNYYAEYDILEELSDMPQIQKTLHTLKISPFYGSRSEMQLIKVLLSCFPRLEKVVIIEKLDSKKDFKIMQELLGFPRASTKAEIVYIK